MRAPAVGLVLASVLASLAGCATYHDDLTRGERAFEASEHERALAIFRTLEPDQGRLSVPDRAHYAYLRGMTDYRIGYKAEARHWLSVASALEQQTPDSLPEDWTKRMKESLKELNEEVYTAGIESLSNTVAGKASKANASDEDQTNDAPAPEPPKKSKPRPKSDDDE